MRFDWKHALRVLVVLAGGGILANAVVLPDVTARAVRAPAGLWWDWIGGLRPLGANLAWLQSQEAWGRGDAAQTAAFLRLAVELQPESLYFWSNGARLLALDLAAVADASGDSPDALRRAGMALLEQARTWHEDNPYYWVERAGLEWQALADGGLAAESYRRAALLPGAPYYAARLHALMLVRQGRLNEAHAWLCWLHPQLPAADPAAQADLVRKRIHGIEQQLELPAEQRYRQQDEL
ncbi:MAG TPA: hypothetical protein PLF88_13355 [Opitutaceae bacterium]|nr:hypothetical protein [Opitutaceae bacterium]